MTKSKQARKQRKALYNAPMHKRQKLVSARLSDKLRVKYAKKSIPVRKGDTVEVMRGDFEGHKGKVEKVDLKRLRIFIEGVTIKRTDGRDRFYPVHPSNVRITKAVTKDERRIKE
ncbi:MAG: 50S ribosomal protein L24 [Candidatus Hydrothermarchaeales archaeon]